MNIFKSLFNVVKVSSKEIITLEKEVEKMTAVEKILLDFLMKELNNNPKLAGNLLLNLLERVKVDPTIANDIVQVFDQILPIVVNSLK